MHIFVKKNKKNAFLYYRTSFSTVSTPPTTITTKVYIYIFLFMFFIGSLFPGSAMISLNLFYSYFKINTILTICINYSFWIIMIGIIYWNIKDRLEL